MSVERGARALCQYLKLNPDDPVRIVSDSGEARMGCRWEDFAAMARAVLAAIREPTAAMVEAGSKYTDWASGAENAWEAMIDEALK